MAIIEAGNSISFSVGWGQSIRIQTQNNVSGKITFTPQSQEATAKSVSRSFGPLATDQTFGPWDVSGNVLIENFSVSNASANYSVIASKALQVNYLLDDIPSQIAYIGQGSNTTTRFNVATGVDYAYTNTNDLGASPTPIRSDANYYTLDVILPAKAGDVIQYDVLISGQNLNTDTTIQLLFSCWSVGGSEYRNWKSGKRYSAITYDSAGSIGALARTGGDTVAMTVSQKVLPSDLSADGFVTLRLYGENSKTGLLGATQTYTFFGLNSKAVSVIYAKNLGRAAKQFKSFVAYPGGTIGSTATLAAQNTGTQNQDNGYPPSPINSTGQFDLVIPAKNLDVVQAWFDIGVTQAGRLAFYVLSVGGSVTREWATNLNFSEMSAALVGPSAISSASGTTRVQGWAVNRVRDTDIDANGNITLRMYFARASSSSALAGTVNSTNGNGSPSTFRAVNYGTHIKWTLIPDAVENKGIGTNYSGGGSVAEPTIYQDNTGQFIQIYSSALENKLYWSTAKSIEGPWTKQGIINLGTVDAAGNEAAVLYENGTLYLYSPKAGATGINCWSGPNPGALTLSGTVFTPSGTASQAFNTSVVKGLYGQYWMFVECKCSATSNTWQIYAAVSNTPTGTFAILNSGNHLSSLEVTIGGNHSTTNGPSVVWMGDHFKMLHHASPLNGAVTPSFIYWAKSYDGINWIRPSLRLDGTPTPIFKNLLELGFDQSADPQFNLVNGVPQLCFTTGYGSGTPGTTYNRGAIARWDAAICDVGIEF